MNKLNKEEWKRIEDRYGDYYISNYGNLTGPKGDRNFSSDKDGYQTTIIEKQNYKAHRLVGIYFLENDSPDTKIEINHLDGDKTNNRYDNLEWSTVSHNRQHAYDTGLRVKQVGSSASAAKLNEVSVLIIRDMIALGLCTYKVIAEAFGVSVSTIQSINDRRTWKHI